MHRQMGGWWQCLYLGLEAFQKGMPMTDLHPSVAERWGEDWMWAGNLKGEYGRWVASFFRTVQCLGKWVGWYQGGERAVSPEILWWKSQNAFLETRSYNVIWVYFTSRAARVFSWTPGGVSVGRSGLLWNICTTQMVHGLRKRKKERKEACWLD